MSIDAADVKPASALMVRGSIEEAKITAKATPAAGNWPQVYWSRDGDGRPFFKRYLDDVRQGKVPTTWWVDEDEEGEPLDLGSVSWPHKQSGHSQTGVKELEDIVGDHGFETRKPLKLITIWCPPDGTVLDPFAGSGTIGHAVVDGQSDPMQPNERRSAALPRVKQVSEEEQDVRGALPGRAR